LSAADMSHIVMQRAVDVRSLLAAHEPGRGSALA